MRKKTRSEKKCIICRCEEVEEAEIRQAVRQGFIDPDAVKRVTRAGMGLCQGRTCRNPVQRIIAEELRVGPGEVAPARYRPPARPVPLAAFLNKNPGYRRRYSGWSWSGTRGGPSPRGDTGSRAQGRARLP